MVFIKKGSIHLAGDPDILDRYPGQVSNTDLLIRVSSCTGARNHFTQLYKGFAVNDPSLQSLVNLST